MQILYEGFDLYSLGLVTLFSDELCLCRAKPKVVFRITSTYCYFSRCNKIFFSKLGASKDCSTDFVVQVQGNERIINSISNIKGAKACPESVARNTYRFGLFGLNMIWKYESKSSSVFQIQCITIQCTNRKEIRTSASNDVHIAFLNIKKRKILMKEC